MAAALDIPALRRQFPGLQRQGRNRPAVFFDGPAGSLTLPAAVDDSVPPGAVFVPYAYPEVQVNRLGAPSGAGLRVKARRAQVTARVGA